MKILIVNSDYPPFLDWLYSRRPGLAEAGYDEQMRARNDSLFGVADFYSGSLCALGHDAWDVHANNVAMQRAWARAHGLRIGPPRPARPGVWAARGRRLVSRLRRRLRRARPGTRPVSAEHRWREEILLEQIRAYKPDVVLNHDAVTIPPRFFLALKPALPLLVAQHAATPVPEAEDWRVYDLAISSFPPTVERFRRLGLPAELHRLGFEPRVLESIGADERSIPLSFVGSLHSVHSSRIDLLERVAARLPLQLWAPGLAQPAASPLHGIYMGPAWGREMYDVLARSRITLNHHGDVPAYANNMRLYEATGMGALLVTDWKANLPDMFEPGKEVVAYQDADECVDLVRYYLTHDREREAIARAGQRRTLRDHTYRRRMAELVQILEKYQ